MKVVKNTQPKLCLYCNMFGKPGTTVWVEITPAGYRCPMCKRILEMDE